MPSSESLVSMFVSRSASVPDRVDDRSQPMSRRSKIVLQKDAPPRRLCKCLPPIVIEDHTPHRRSESTSIASRDEKSGDFWFDDFSNSAGLTGHHG